MKRNRSELDPPEECGITRRTTKLRRPCGSVSSSSSHDVRGRRSSGGGGGVVGATTVTQHRPASTTQQQTHADPHHSCTMAQLPAAPDHPHSTMLLPKLIKEALVNGTAEQLYEYIDQKFLLKMPSSETWSEECESLIAAAFVGLLWGKSGTSLTRMQLLLQNFLQRWHENGTFEDFVADCATFQKSSLFCCLIHVFDILECSNLNMKILKECLEWQGREIPPRWLSDISGIKNGNYSDINNLLHAVSSMIKRQDLNLKYKNNYTGSLLHFLTANQYYQKGLYNESLSMLNGLSVDNQGDDLSGWVQWISGINLIHCGKYHSALLKLQTAIDSSIFCTRALFTVSQLFHLMDQKAAELETLSLLAIADHSGESLNHNLQSCLLDRLHPWNPEVNIVALFLLAARFLQQKMFKDASKRFKELMNKLKHPPIAKRPIQTLLRSQDDIPPMPEILCLKILSGLAEYKNGNFKEALDIIGKITLIEDINIFESETKEKVLCISAICGHLVRMKSNMNMNNLKEALSTCIELENMMMWTPGNESSSGWSHIILLSKVALYQTAAMLQSSLKHQRNEAHYQRLVAQCCVGITAEKSKKLVKSHIGTTEWICLSLCHQIVIEDLYDFLIELADFECIFI